MRKKLEKIFGIEINEKVFAVLSVLVMLALIFPVARIMKYCVPWYDDFSYGRFGKYAWDAEHSFGAVLDAAAYHVKTAYYNWQGYFSSGFLMSIMPAIWGTDKYVYGLWFILLVFVVGIFCIVNVLLRDVLGAGKWDTLAVQAIVGALCVLLFRSPIEGLFWYNAAMHYTAMHSFGIMFIALLIKLIYTRKKALKWVLMGLSLPVGFFVGGANYVSVLQITLLALSVLGWGAIFRKREVCRAIPGTCALLAAVIVNVTAPGNAMRMEHFTALSLSPAEAIWQSFVSAVTYFDDFTGWMTLAVILLLLPIVIRIVSKSNFEFKYPGLVLLWSFCLYATGFTPTLYTMGHTLLSRATNMAKYTFQLLLVLNVFYLVGWLYRFCKEKKSKEIKVKNSLCYYGLIVLMMIGIFAAEPNKGGIYSTYCAYYFVHTGEAYNYYQEYLQRVEICESDEADVVIRPYVFRPWLLCLGDLSSDPYREQNRCMAEYFGKNSITCISVEEEEKLREEQK